MFQQATRTDWDEFVRTRSAECRERLVLLYSGLVYFVVNRYSAPVSSNRSALEEGDLVQVGMMGLMDAIERYDPSRGVKFETYALTRIRGTIQDELRRLDWFPRSVRKRARAAGRPDKSYRRYYDNDTRMGEESEVAMTQPERLGLIEDLPADLSESAPELMSSAETRELLIHAVEKLEPRERVIVTLYYYENLTFKEIAKVVHLSESRVSQIHSDVLAQLRKQLQNLI